MALPSEDQLPYFGALLDHTEDAIVASDAAWRVTLWNAGARRLFGWTAEEAVGQPAAFFGFVESDAQRVDRRRQVAEHGRWRGEVTVQRKDGSEVAAESIALAIRDEQAEISGYLEIHRDITERRRAEQALRASHQRTEAVLERISDTFFAVDARWRYTYVNARAVAQARKAWGRQVSAGELLGRNCWELFPETVGTRFDQQLHRAMRDQKVVEFETSSVVTEASVEVRAYPSKDGLSVYSRDATERRRAEEALREANRRSEVILESISDFFSAFDHEWRYTYLTRRGLDRFRKATGEDVSLDDIIGQNYWELFPQVVGTTIDHEFHRAVREQVTVGFEILSPVGGVWLDICAYPTDEGLSVYWRDISERKEAAQRVVAAREAERRRMARALHDEALQGLGDAIALAATADRTIAESRLADQLLPVLQRAGQQLRAAIYDLRLQSEEHTPFIELLEQLVDEHRRMMGHCEIQLEVGEGIPPGSLGVKGVEVLRILGEALTNARRHADAQRIHVRVWAVNDRLGVEVSDDGRGFDTASPAPPLHRGITGMRERAEWLNGRLDIHSEPGVGTTVRLEAPLGDATS